jgi:hypothetical protein
LAGAQPLEPAATFRGWTDDYSDIVSIIDLQNIWQRMLGLN